MKWYQAVNPFYLIRAMSVVVTVHDVRLGELQSALVSATEGLEKLARIVHRHQPCQSCATLIDTSRKGPRRVVSPNPDKSFWVCGNCFSARRHSFEEIKK